MNTNAGSNIKMRTHTHLHQFPQIWFLFVSVCAFGLYVAWDQGLLHTVFSLDRSYVTSVIAVLVLVSSCHAAWHIFLFSTRLAIAEQLLIELPENSDAASSDEYLSNYLYDLELTYANEYQDTTSQNSNDSDAIVDIYSDRLRSPVELGWFLVDLTVRLGLLGTIVGFILIFTSLSSTSIDGADGLKELLVSMSGGMGTALFTTLGGLIGATFISFQYLILGREAEQLISSLIRVRSRFQSRLPD